MSYSVKELSSWELTQTSKTILKKPACFFDIAFKQSIADSALDQELHYMHRSNVEYNSIQLLHPLELFAQLLTSCTACPGD